MRQAGIFMETSNHSGYLARAVMGCVKTILPANTVLKNCAKGISKRRIQPNVAAHID